MNEQETLGGKIRLLREDITEQLAWLGGLNPLIRWVVRPFLFRKLLRAIDSLDALEKRMRLEEREAILYDLAKDLGKIPR